MPRKLLFLTAVALFAVLFSLPTQFSASVFGSDSFLGTLKLKKGLDLVGGAQLEYAMDMSHVDPKDIPQMIQGVKTVVDTRVNGLGLVEPNVYTAQVGNNHHIFVELPEVKDLSEAIAMVGKTVTLEFKEQKDSYSPEQKEQINQANQNIMAQAKEASDLLKKGKDFGSLQMQYSQVVGKNAQTTLFATDAPEVVAQLQKAEKGFVTGPIRQGNFVTLYKLLSTEEKEKTVPVETSGADAESAQSKTVKQMAYTVDRIQFALRPDVPQGGFAETGLTGKQFKRADVIFDEIGRPTVQIQFDTEGAQLFSDITQRNLRKPVAIYLDGEMISSPTVQTVIRDGRAVISGAYTLTEAKKLASQLNTGAIPVPIRLVSQQTVGASLGQDSFDQSVMAGILGFLLVSVYMVFQYRFAGFLAVLALLLYTGLNLAVTKLFGITLSLAGIAGFILSIGMAVDANILIFERMKEEIRSGKSLQEALGLGFERAWSSIRDSNSSSLITCAILFLFSSGMIRGFALALAIGILLSLFTAVTITRTLLQLSLGDDDQSHGQKLFGKKA